MKYAHKREIWNLNDNFVKKVTFFVYRLQTAGCYDIITLMEEILQAITSAEQKAARIKADALEKAAKIAADAEAAASGIAGQNEEECRALRDKAIKDAENLAKDNYAAAIKKKTAECAAFADNAINKSENISKEIVRRILRGGC